MLEIGFRPLIRVNFCKRDDIEVEEYERLCEVSVPLSGLAFVNISNPVKKEKVQSSFPSPYRG